MVRVANQETLNSFDSIYKTTYNDISKYVVCNCNNIEDVKDILQNIYIEVFNCLNKNIKVTKSYIIGIAKHKVKDYYRFSYKYKIISLFAEKENKDFAETIPDTFDLEEYTSKKYDIDLVWKYIKKKKVIISKIFYLYFKLDLTIKEISECLNITESNTKHYLYRTLKELNKYLESKGDI